MSSNEASQQPPSADSSPNAPLHLAEAVGTDATPTRQPHGEKIRKRWRQPSPYGAKLTEFRVEYRFTQKRLATLAGYSSDDSISMLENGNEQYPQFLRHQAILRALATLGVPEEKRRELHETFTHRLPAAGVPVAETRRAASPDQAARTVRGVPHASSEIRTVPHVDRVEEGASPPQRTFAQHALECAQASPIAVLLVCVAVVAISLFLLARVIPAPTSSLHTAATTYRASIPGKPCDHGGATWVNDSGTRATCSGGSLVLTGAQNGRTFVQELFYPPSAPRAGAALRRYQIEVAISHLAAESCAGLQYQLSYTAPYHDSVAVCADGSVALLRMDTSGRQQTLLSPPGLHVTPASVYHVVLAFVDGAQAVTVNGQALPTVSDRLAGTCNFISLAASTTDGQVAHAAFTNFAFTRLLP